MWLAKLYHNLYFLTFVKLKIFEYWFQTHLSNKIHIVVNNKIDYQNHYLVQQHIDEKKH